MSAYRIGIDIGGTFTDFTVVDEASGSILIDKTLTTPRAPEEAVLSGLERLAASIPGLLVGSSRVDLQACKLEYSIVSPK